MPLRGSRKWKFAPCGSAWDAHRRPPQSSTMLRHNGRPSPVPVALVVKKASKICSMSSDAIPVPVSLTCKSTSLPSISAEDIAMRRGRFAEARMDSIALVTRLMSTR